MSWPVAFAAVRIPVARPRRATNQRLAITAARVTDTAPVAVPFTNPQSRMNCHWVLIASVSADPAATIETAIKTQRRSPNLS